MKLPVELCYMTHYRVCPNSHKYRAGVLFVGLSSVKECNKIDGHKYRPRTGNNLCIVACLGFFFRFFVSYRKQTRHNESSDEHLLQPDANITFMERTVQNT